MQLVEGSGSGDADPVAARLADLVMELGVLVMVDQPAADAARVDRIAVLERLRAVTAAVQAAECVRFAKSQTAEQMARGVHPRTVGRGVADQIALACRVSPHAGSARLSTARALWHDLPGVYGLLAGGEVSERLAEQVVTETRHLDAATRRRVDTQLVDAGVSGMGVKAAVGTARRLAYVADPQGYLSRGRTERKHRRVGLRPAPDTMAVLTGYLPVEQGVACYAALRQHTDTQVAAGDGRTRDQIMADTMVARLTGQQSAGDVAVEVVLTMPVDALLDPDDPTPAELTGHGPLPAGLARDLITTTQGKRWWRRLFLSPFGQVVGGDPKRRRFDGFLATLIRHRDQTCRDPFCDAAIRHLDHVRRHRRGGPTTLANGRGVCARGNYTRETPGWSAHTLHDGVSGHLPHTVQVTTPTGHTYTNQAPRPP